MVYFYRQTVLYCACCGSVMQPDFLSPAPSAVGPHVIRYVAECPNPNCEQYHCKVGLPLEQYDDLAGVVETWEPIKPPPGLLKQAEKTKANASENNRDF